MEFYNKLTKTHISDIDYKSCRKAWKNQKMSTFRDFVKYYKDLDVKGMVDAIAKMV